MRFILPLVALAALGAPAHAQVEIVDHPDRPGARAVYHWDRATAKSAGDAETTARAFLRAHADALFGDALPEFTETEARAKAAPHALRTERVRSSLSGQQVIQQQYVRGVPVHDARVRVNLDRDGRPLSAISGFDPRALDAPTQPALDPAQALAIARGSLDRPGEDRQRPDVALTILIHEGEAHLAYRTEIPLWSPFGDWETFVDARTGEILRQRNRMVFEKTVGERLEITPPVQEPAPANPGFRKTDKVDGSGLVFPVNPLNNEPSRYGFREQTVDMDPYREARVLPRLDGSGFLRGQWADVFNSDQPRANEPSLQFNYSSEITNSAFHEVNVYWHVDTIQDYIQNTLGITNANAEAQDLYAHQGEDDNSSYSPSGDFIRFGDGGVDDSEDGEIVLHEYGHALHDAISGIGGNEAGAISEGFGDYLACSFADSPLEGEWDATSYNPGPPPYLRRTDGTKTYGDKVGQVHADGEIISAAWWQLRERIGQVKADQLVIESFFLVDATVSMAEMGNAAVLADQSINAGAHVGIIRSIFAEREILSSHRLAIAHTPLADQPDPAGPYPVTLDLDHSEPIQQVQLFWRPAGATGFTAISMTEAGGDRWTATIPGPGQSTRIEYYLSVLDGSDASVLDPAGAPGSVHSFATGTPRAQVLGLAQNRPNPFNPRTTLEFDLPREGRVVLRIFDVAGRPVRTLVDREYPVGTHPVEWDGTDDEGQALASGIYLYRVESNGAARTKRMVLVR